MESSRPVSFAQAVASQTSREATRRAFNPPRRKIDMLLMPYRWAFPRSLKSGRDGWSTRLFKWTMTWRGVYMLFVATLLQSLLMRLFLCRMACDAMRCPTYATWMRFVLSMESVKPIQPSIDPKAVAMCERLIELTDK